jgi:catechol 2,3-dioxygenase-like lactoylglutathione lyase family enzyme
VQRRGALVNARPDAAALAIRAPLRQHAGPVTHHAPEDRMFSHIMVGSNDLARSKTFYDATFGALGAKPAMVDDKGRLIYMHNGGLFMVTQPIDGKPATPANGGTIGIACSSAEQANAWHAAGVAAGGSSCEDPPGVREGGFGKLYLAYLRDPDGNKLCGLHRM